MSIIVEARCNTRQLVLQQLLSLPEGQRVRITIESIDDTPVGQQTVAQWRGAGVIGAWANRCETLSSAHWARQLRRQVSLRSL